MSKLDQKNKIHTLIQDIDDLLGAIRLQIFFMFNETETFNSSIPIRKLAKKLESIQEKLGEI